MPLWCAELSWDDSRAAEEAAEEARDEEASHIAPKEERTDATREVGCEVTHEVTMSRRRGEPPDDDGRELPDDPDDADGSDGDEDDGIRNVDDFETGDDEADDAIDEGDDEDSDELPIGGGDEDEDEDDDGEGDEETTDDELPASTVFVATATPLQLSVAPMPDERAPDGVCLASRIDGRLVARCAMPGESIERLMTLKLFEEPVMIGLLAFEGEPGIQARLVALVPSERLTEGGSEDDEPWKASVPSFEKAQREAAEGEEDDAEGAGLAAVLLGHIVRFAQDRKHPDDLAREAVDILQRVVAGAPLSDAAAKAIDDLLDSL